MTARKKRKRRRKNGLEKEKRQPYVSYVMIHTTSECVWLCCWWELRCCFYLSTAFHATMPLLLYSFWFSFYFGFIMCLLCTVGYKHRVPFELQLSLFLIWMYSSVSPSLLILLSWCVWKFICDYFHLNPSFLIFRNNFNDTSDLSIFCNSPL